MATSSLTFLQRFSPRTWISFDATEDTVRESRRKVLRNGEKAARGASQRNPIAKIRGKKEEDSLTPRSFRFRVKEPQETGRAATSCRNNTHNLAGLQFTGSSALRHCIQDDEPRTNKSEFVLSAPILCACLRFDCLFMCLTQELDVMLGFFLRKQIV